MPNKVQADSAQGAQPTGGHHQHRRVGAGASGPILVRGDSADGNRKVVRTCLRAGAQFSLVMTRNPAVERALTAIDENAWTPVSYPGAVRDPDTGVWIPDAEVAEIPYTAFASTTDRIIARLVARGVKDARFPDALFPVWRNHPFFTNTDLPVEQADITHRQHAIIKTVFADLTDGPLAHIPSGRFGANSAWMLCAAIAHNLLRATGVLAGERHTLTRGSTLRLKIVDVPARLVFIESALGGAGFEDVWSFTKPNPAMTFIPLLLSGELTEQLIAGREELYLLHLWDTFTANKDRVPFDSWAPYLAALKRPGLIRSGANYYRAVYAGADGVRRLIAAGKLTIPVLSVAGSASFGAGQRALVDAFAENVCADVVIDDAGHFVAEEQPEALLAELDDFLIKGSH